MMVMIQLLIFCRFLDFNDDDGDDSYVKIL
jgi:hypothetical protein